MKKIRLAVYMVAFGVLFTSCELQVKPDKTLKTDNVEASKIAPDGAGTNFEFPNTFDADGNLCINVNSPIELVGEPMELWMGVGNEKAGTLVGHVTFLSDPDRVRIDLKDFDGDDVPDMYPYVVNVAHIHFASDVDGIPHTPKGNPIPGQFEYNVDIEALTTIIEIPVMFDAVGAIHLEIEYHTGIPGFNLILPDEYVDLTMIKNPSTGGASYWEFKLDNADFLSEYDGSGLLCLYTGIYSISSANSAAGFSF